MNFLYKNRLSVSILFYCLLFIITWPLYKYVSDQDGIGYAAVSHHYLNGDWKKAINGFWNPLHSWLIIPFIKAGLTDGVAFKISNALFSIGSLVVLNSLVNQFSLSNWLKFCILVSSSITLLAYTHFELAADVLLVLLLLIFYCITKEDKFYTSITLNIAAGAIGALLYLAKSYGFPFFLFHFLMIHIFLNPNRKKALMLMITGIAVFLIITFPWLWALHWKYGQWMIAHGKYNAHWNFTGGVISGPIIQPPPYESSSSVWEDPWHVRRDNLNNTPILTIALHQLRTALFNFQKWLVCIHELSFLATGILFMSSIMYLQTKSRHWL
jgi:hypothetical protein